MPAETEVYSNPVAPAASHPADDKGSSRLTNEDFRKLLMTPRAPPPTAPPTVTHDKAPDTAEAEDRAEKRKKRKSYYAELKRQEEDMLKELDKKYRDRARERREGASTDPTSSDDPLANVGAYRAVAPDAKSGLDAAERRKQMIQESKFLGGDMEHTHLVKGLDYALLQKARSEIQSKEREEEEEMKKLASASKETQKKPKEEEPEPEMFFKTKLGRNIARVLFKGGQHDRNELFLPSRMAYVIDLDDEFSESDIPTTLIRSKQDIPNVESQTTLTSNDIVIDKLTQILSYLRQGNRVNKKAKKKEKNKPDDKPKMDESIYGDIGNYVPSVQKREKERNRDRSRDYGRDRDRGRESYFEKSAAQEQVREEKKMRDQVNDFLKDQGLTNIPTEEPKKQDEKKPETKLTGFADVPNPDVYAECYPGFYEMQDAIEDSDDEADYTKMDMGNKKGPVGRWDFDTQEEYSDYMANKEALPKAAFQYGVKMADGRKTRRMPKHKEKNERAELDREWRKISAIIDRRKSEKVSRRDGEPPSKSMRR